MSSILSFVTILMGALILIGAVQFYSAKTLFELWLSMKTVLLTTLVLVFFGLWKGVSASSGVKSAIVFSTGFFLFLSLFFALMTRAQLRLKTNPHKDFRDLSR